jgi:hypothetical protein
MAQAAWFFERATLQNSQKFLFAFSAVDRMFQKGTWPKAKVEEFDFLAMRKSAEKGRPSKSWPSAGA